MPKNLVADADRKRLGHPSARVSALMCIAGLLLELGLLLKHHFRGGHPPDAGLTLGLAGALLVNLYLMRRNQSHFKVVSISIGFLAAGRLANYRHYAR